MPKKKQLVEAVENPATQQADVPKKKTVKPNNNPTGIGGFREHPELRNPGGWKKESTVSYWYRFFLNMPADKFKNYEKQVPESERCVAESIAYPAVMKARGQIRYLQEITNRTEGMPKQSIDYTVQEPILDEEEADRLLEEIDINAPDSEEAAEGLQDPS